MRRVEGLIMDQPTASALVRSFVLDFIEASVVQDYRNLHARESPYRFRGLILDVGGKLLEDEAALAKIASGWVSGGIAPEAASAREPVITDLRDVVCVFAEIDDHVRDIETTTYRIERRMTNVVRFSDRMASVSTDRILHAIGLLGSSRIDAGATIEAPTRLQLDILPIAAAQFYFPPRRRAEAEDREIEVRAPDPALARYLEAVDAFEGRIGITSARLRHYVEEALGDSIALPAAAFPVENVDDFLRLSTRALRRIRSCPASRGRRPSPPA